MNSSRKTATNWLSAIGYRLSAIGYRLILGVLVSVFALQAQANCNFFDAFVDNNDGTITDPRDGLIWKRCSEGSDWSGTSCSGTPNVVNWYQAMQLAKNSQFLSKNDWRLPTGKEIISVASKNMCEVYSASGHKYLPAISARLNNWNETMSFWSATTHGMISSTRGSINEDAGFTDFFGRYGGGRYTSGNKGIAHNSRLVRGGQASEISAFEKEYEEFVLPHQRTLEVKAKEEADRQKQIQADAAKEALCMRTPSCKAKRVAQEAQERRDQAARDEQYRRDAPARQARQMCEAQKQTCFASCPPWRSTSYRENALIVNDAHFSCLSRCNSISCN